MRTSSVLVRMNKISTAVAIFTAVLVLVALPVCLPAQYQAPPPQYGAPPQQPGYGPPPPPMAPPDLDRLVYQIALYPDPLLTQVLTASTFPDQIQPAAQWADEHGYIHGDQLARAIAEDRLPWDPSVQALLPFPNVLDTMARDMGWTAQLGNAFLSQPGQVVDAVQRMRQQAYNYGYLRSNPQMNVVYSGGVVEILPVNPGYIYVPYYNPAIVFAPRRGISIGAAISFGPGIVIGAGFSPYGWGGPHFDWRARTVIIDNHPWQRRWDNRSAYVHPYNAPPPRVEARPSQPAERHDLRGRGDYHRDERGRGREEERRR